MTRLDVVSPPLAGGGGPTAEIIETGDINFANAWVDVNATDPVYSMRLTRLGGATPATGDVCTVDGLVTGQAVVAGGFSKILTVPVGWKGGNQAGLIADGNSRVLFGMCAMDATDGGFYIFLPDGTSYAADGDGIPLHFTWVIR